MTQEARAKKLYRAIRKALYEQHEAKRINGKDCFTSNSLKSLVYLHNQLEKAFKELANSVK